MKENKEKRQKKNTFCLARPAFSSPGRTKLLFDLHPPPPSLEPPRSRPREGPCPPTLFWVLLSPIALLLLCRPRSAGSTRWRPPMSCGWGMVWSSPDRPVVSALLAAPSLDPGAHLVWVGCVVVSHRSTNHAQPTNRFRVFGCEAAFWRSNPSSPSLFPSLEGGLVDRSGLGLPVSLFHGISIRPPTDLVALPMRLMAWWVCCIGVLSVPASQEGRQ